MEGAKTNIHNDAREKRRAEARQPVGHDAGAQEVTRGKSASVTVAPG